MLSNLDHIRKVGVIGDTHRSYNSLKWAVETLKNDHGCDYVIQAGDFGVGFGTPEQYTLKVNTLGLDAVLLGNHDEQDNDGGCPRWVDKWGLSNVRLLGRGERLRIGGRDFLFMGGAESIDKEYRTPMVSWWPGETIRERDVQSVELGVNTDVVISHTVPSCIVNAMGVEVYPGKGLGMSERALDWLLEQMIYVGCTPRAWIGAHWHAPWNGMIRGVSGHVLDRVDDEFPDGGIAVIDLHTLTVLRFSVG